MKREPLFIDGKLNAGKCNDCGVVRFPRRDYCNYCQSTNISEYLLGPQGKLETFTISYMKPMIGRMKPPYPYGVAIFLTDDGQKIHVIGLIDSQEPFEDVKIDKGLILIEDKLLIKFKMEAD
ncbi:MAG: hypothetical protein EU529_08725 [Promethearchaeota archaeon]|nr:MAG: hypothetical protein EU529_08725 [Candidatus Lokiarchaeota archaeon]